MLNEVLELLQPEEGKMFLDCTFGGGGHTRAILEAAPKVMVVSIDQDPEAKDRAARVQADHADHFHFYDLNFSQLDQVNESGFDGALFDLGVSSFQLDQYERGFSFRENAPVDMRLDPRKGVSGAEFLEKATENEIIKAIRDYGEEPRWRRVTRAIIAARGTGALSETKALADLIAQEAGAPRPGRKSIHPATRSFQGIRIAVNHELTVLEEALPLAVEKLKNGGILAVISFHSLEDRIVKRFFKRLAGRPEHAQDYRTQDERTQEATLLTTKPIKPSDKEINNNPRSRSAKLRAIKKII